MRKTKDKKNRFPPFNLASTLFSYFLRSSQCTANQPQCLSSFHLTPPSPPHPCGRSICSPLPAQGSQRGRSLPVPENAKCSLSSHGILFCLLAFRSPPDHQGPSLVTHTCIPFFGLVVVFGAGIYGFCLLTSFLLMIFRQGIIPHAFYRFRPSSSWVGSRGRGTWLRCK